MKKIILFCLGIFAITQLIGCATAARQSKQADETDIKLRMQQFEQARGLSASEIPEQYDVSRLRQGSKVKIKYTCNNSKGSVLIAKLLREVRSNGNNKDYLIDLVRDKDTSTFQEDASSMARVVRPQEAPDFAKSVNNSYQGPNFPTAIIQGALTGGPIGVAVNLSQYSRMKEAGKQRAQQFKDTKMESKIISCDLISNERLKIASREVLCRVYQVHTMTRQIMPSSESLPGMRTVVDESKKVWISDEVPFGFVKSQGIQTACIYLDSTGRFPGQTVNQKPQENISEVVEFSY